MFNSTEDRGLGVPSVSPIPEVMLTGKWIILLSKHTGVDACVQVGALGCMRDSSFETLAFILDEPQSKIKSQFTFALETTGKQVLKVGNEGDLQKRCFQAQMVACQCLFRLELAKHL